MKDEVISFWVDFGLMFLIVTVLYWLMKKSLEKMVAICMASVCSVLIASHVCTTCCHRSAL